MNNTRIQTILIITLAITSIALFRQCTVTANARNEASRDAEIASQNLRALSGKIQIEKTKNGFTEAVKSSYVTKINDLEALNADLYQEIKNTKDRVISIIKTQTVTQMQPVTMGNEIVNYMDSITHGLKFRSFTSDSGATWRIEGESQFRLNNGRLSAGTTTITKNQTTVNLVLGFKETNDDFQVFARSASPNVTIGELDGVMIIPKKKDITQAPNKIKRFGIGPQMGVGVTNNLTVNAYIGIGLNYNIIKF